MFPRSRRRAATRAASVAIALGLVLGGCGSTFDPTGPCTADGSAPGAYPDLEAAVPALFRDAKPSDLDSGRACTPTGLATLATHGIKELRFAGGTWSTGTDSGISLAIFTTAEGPPLDPAWLTEFFATGATTGKNVTSVDTSDYDVAPGISGQRIDVLNGESYQSIVVWQQDSHVAAALIGDFIREIQTKAAHDVVVRDAVDTLAR